MGRTPVVTQTQALDEDDLVSILTEPKNAVVRQYRKMFQLEDVDLEFEDAALHEIARMALARKTGARGLRAICEDVLQQTKNSPNASTAKPAKNVLANSLRPPAVGGYFIYTQ